MKKALYGLLGLAMLGLPLNLSSQEKSKTYEYNIYLGGTDIGDGKCDKEKVNLSIDWLFKKELIFTKNKNDYSEIYKSGNFLEKYEYKRTDSLRLENYLYYHSGKIDNSLKRESKLKEIKKGHEKNTLFGVEVFDYFTGDSIPKKIDTQVFGDFYSFQLDEKFGVKKIQNDLFRVKYNILVNPKSNGDEFRMNEPIQVDLKKEGENYHIYSAKVSGELKFIFWIPLSISISEK